MTAVKWMINIGDKNTSISYKTIPVADKTQLCREYAPATFAITDCDYRFVVGLSGAGGFKDIASQTTFR